MNNVPSFVPAGMGQRPSLFRFPGLTLAAWLVLAWLMSIDAAYAATGDFMSQDPDCSYGAK